jgi:DNA-binding LytR/AlgR family response regulator
LPSLAPDRKLMNEVRRVPYERENAIRFLAADQISAVRADGHYTMVMRDGTEFFCPSICRAGDQIATFIRTHRSTS